jgi:hypothetical protein
MASASRSTGSRTRTGARPPSSLRPCVRLSVCLSAAAGARRGEVLVNRFEMSSTVVNRPDTYISLVPFAYRRPFADHRHYRSTGSSSTTIDGQPASYPLVYRLLVNRSPSINERMVNRF